MKERQFKPSSWDKKTQVAVCAHLPLKRVAFTSLGGVAKIVFDYETFIAAYEKESDWVYEHAGQHYHYRDLIEALKERIISTDEIDIGALANEVGVPLDFCFNRVLYPAVKDGKFCLFDVENDCYVDSYVVRSYGLQVAPLAGKGGEEYMLPSGKVFLEGGWIS